MKFAKRNMLLPVVMTAILAMWSLPAWGTTVEFAPDNAVFAEADLQVVQVLVSDVTDMLGASVTIEFDPAVVTPVSASLGNFMNQGPCGAFFQWINAGTFVNTIELDAAMLGCTVGGSGTLFNVTFAGVGAGTSPLTLTVTDLRDGVNAPIAAASLAGALTYVPVITANLSFQPEAVLFEEDGTTVICLTLEGVTDFLGMSVTFDFDPSVLIPISIAPGQGLIDAGCPFYLDWLNAGTFVNTMEIDMALLGCSGPMDGPVACITFQGVQFGESPLIWQQVAVRDSNNQTVPANSDDGLVLYDPAVATEAVSLGALKCLYRQ